MKVTVLDLFNLKPEYLWKFSLFNYLFIYTYTMHLFYSNTKTADTSATKRNNKALFVHPSPMALLNLKKKTNAHCLSQNFHSQYIIGRSTLCQSQNFNIFYEWPPVSKAFSKFMRRIMQGDLYIFQYPIVSGISLFLHKNGF